MLAEIFPRLTGFFQGTPFNGTGIQGNTPANYIHAYNESRFFYHKTSKCYWHKNIDRILNGSQQATRKIIGGNCESTKRFS